MSAGPESPVEERVLADLRVLMDGMKALSTRLGAVEAKVSRVDWRSTAVVLAPWLLWAIGAAWSAFNGQPLPGIPGGN